MQDRKAHTDDHVQYTLHTQSTHEHNQKRDKKKEHILNEIFIFAYSDDIYMDEQHKNGDILHYFTMKYFVWVYFFLLTLFLHIKEPIVYYNI